MKRVQISEIWPKKANLATLHRADRDAATLKFSYHTDIQLTKPHYLTVFQILFE